MVLATAVAVAVSMVRQGQNQRFAELVRLATVAQEAVLRPIGPQVGQLAVAGRYVSASAAADIGGDLYEALDTPYGVRMIIGDVRGKGIDAVRLASIVLGSYRHVAYERADLRAIVADLDRAVARSVGDEDFVTAALVEERGGTLTVVNCGHPAPLLLRRGRVIPLDPPRPAPPLGFSPGGAGPGRAPGARRPAAALHRRAGRGPARPASSSRPPSGPGRCSATAPSSTGWPRWRARWPSGCAVGSTTTSRWCCWSTPAPHPSAEPAVPSWEIGGTAGRPRLSPGATSATRPGQSGHDAEPPRRGRWRPMYHRGYRGAIQRMPTSGPAWRVPSVSNCDA